MLITGLGEAAHTAIPILECLFVKFCCILPEISGVVAVI